MDEIYGNTQILEGEGPRYRRCIHRHRTLIQNLQTKKISKGKAMNNHLSFMNHFSK